MTTAINNANVIIGNGTYLERGSVLFDETQILAVGSTPQSADVVLDGRGKTVSPGFIDCHTHLGLPLDSGGYRFPGENRLVEATAYAMKQAQDFFSSGITTIRTMGCFQDIDLLLRDMERQGLISIPRIRGTGQAICITAGHGSDMGIGMECDTVGEVLKAARTQIKKGADFIKMMPTSGVIGIGPATEVQLSREQIEAICSVGKAFNTPTCAHIQNTAALYQCVEAGITSVEHGAGIDTAEAEFLLNHGTWYIPTAVVSLHISQFTPADSDKHKDLREKATAIHKKIRHGLECCIAKGVAMALGTDSGCAYTDPAHFAFAHEMKLYCECGMQPMDVFTCATLRGAELLRISAEVGTLEVGKAPDIVVIDGDPIRNISAVQNVFRTYKSGKLVYQNSQA